MSVSTLLAAALLSLPLGLAAQTTLPPDPSQANAAVPEVHYVSALERYPRAEEIPATSNSPDKTWRAANIEVGTLRGHAGHLNAAAPTDPVVPAEPGGTVPVDHSLHH